jgi:DNA-binding transcriptional LysR family regulator
MARSSRTRSDPTPRALAIQQRLHQLIEEASALVEIGRDVDLASLQRTFTVRANDALISLLTARLVTRVQASAPGVTIRFVPEGDEDLAPLRDGLIDLAVGMITGFGPEIRTQLLYAERLVGLVAARHPLAAGRVTLRRIAAAEHISVSRRGRTRGAFDDILDQHGLARKVAVVVPTYTVAAHISASSALTGLITASYAAQVAALTGGSPLRNPG